MDIAAARLHATRAVAVLRTEAAVRPLLLLREAVIQAEDQVVRARLTVAAVHARPEVAEVVPFHLVAEAVAEAVAEVEADDKPFFPVSNDNECKLNKQKL